MRNFTPLNDMILVLPDPVATKIGLLHLPEGVLKNGDQPGDSQTAFTGTVVACGPGDPMKSDPSKRHVMYTKVGDRVAYPRRPNMRGGTDLVQIDGVGYLMFNEEQSAYAIIEN